MQPKADIYVKQVGMWTFLPAGGGKVAQRRSVQLVNNQLDYFKLQKTTIKYRYIL